MRKWIVIGVVAVCGVGIAGTAFANYFYPARVIIGTGIISGGGTTSTTSTLGQDAQKMGGGEGCTIAPPIECKCAVPEMPVWQACLESKVDLQCLKPDSPYDAIKQAPDVVREGKEQVIGALRCGKGDGDALVNLP